MQIMLTFTQNLDKSDILTPFRPLPAILFVQWRPLVLYLCLQMLIEFTSYKILRKFFTFFSHFTDLTELLMVNLNFGIKWLGSTKGSN